jgi:twitching motility protein PilI
MAKRLSLREFQQSVIARLQAGSQAGQRASTLGVQIGDGYWLVEMSDISEVLPVPSVTEVPLTRRWFWGVANVRGNVYSLVDMADFLEYGETAREGGSRALLISPRYGFSTGLVVSRVLGLRNAHEWPSREQDGQVIHTDDQGQVWRKLDMSALLKQPQFLQIEM